MPRAARLRASGEIRRTVRRGRRFEAGPYVVHGLPAASSSGSRLAVVVPRRVGNQVARNRIKRIFREAFRLDRADWARHWDLVLYVRSTPSQPTLDEAVALLQRAVKTLGRSPKKLSEDN